MVRHAKLRMGYFNWRDELLGTSRPRDEVVYAKNPSFLVMQNFVRFVERYGHSRSRR